MKLKGKWSERKFVIEITNDSEKTSEKKMTNESE